MNAFLLIVKAPPRDPTPAPPFLGPFRRKLRRGEGGPQPGSRGSPCAACPPAPMPGAENKPAPPFPPGMLILVQEFPVLPRVPRPSRPCTVTSAAGHLVVITHGGRGLGGPAAQPPRAQGGWSLSCEGAQLLLALISCGDFLTGLEPPGRRRLWEPGGFRKDGPPLSPMETRPPKPPGALRAEGAISVGGGEGWENRGGMCQQLRVPLTVHP